MRYFFGFGLLVLGLWAPLLGTPKAEREPCQSLFSQRDKQLHMGAGFLVALSTNVILERMTREAAPPSPLAISQWHAADPSFRQVSDPTAFLEYRDNTRLSPWERAAFSALAAGIVGAGYEFVNSRKSPPDQNDVLATFLGGVGAGLFTLVIDF